MAGGGAVIGAPQNPQNRLPKGRVFRQRGQVTTAGVGAEDGAASAGCPGMGFPQRAHVAEVAGFGAPQAGQRVYRMVPCSLDSLAMAVSLSVFLAGDCDYCSLIFTQTGLV
jgi:hypothetical protein